MLSKNKYTYVHTYSIYSALDTSSCQAIHTDKKTTLKADLQFSSKERKLLNLPSFLTNLHLQKYFHCLSDCTNNYLTGTRGQACGTEVARGGPWPPWQAYLSNMGPLGVILSTNYY